MKHLTEPPISVEEDAAIAALTQILVRNYLSRGTAQQHAAAPGRPERSGLPADLEAA